MVRPRHPLVPSPSVWPEPESGLDCLICAIFARRRTARPPCIPPQSECDTYKTVKAKFWLWLQSRKDSGFGFKANALKAVELFPLNNRHGNERVSVLCSIQLRSPQSLRLSLSHLARSLFLPFSLALSLSLSPYLSLSLSLSVLPLSLNTYNLSRSPRWHLPSCGRKGERHATAIEKRAESCYPTGIWS